MIFLASVVLLLRTESTWTGSIKLATFVKPHEYEWPSRGIPSRSSVWITANIAQIMIGIGSINKLDACMQYTCAQCSSHL